MEVTETYSYWGGPT